MVPTPNSPAWADPLARHLDETHFAKDMIEYVDTIVGRVVRKLDELGLRENTLLLFFSDNGTNARVVSRMGNRIVRGGKGKSTDLGTRVPLIANWPGVTPAGAVSDALVDSTDFLPTLLAAAGVKLPPRDEIDGRSFFPQLQGNSGQPRDWIYMHQDPRPGWDKDRFYLVRFARNQRFKLYEDGRLFDQPREVKHDAVPFRVNLATAGQWQLTIRHRTDHPHGRHQPAFWVRIDDGPWMICRSADPRSGGWHWTRQARRPDDASRQAIPMKFNLAEKRHTIYLAPYVANIKIDRLVLYQEGCETRALSEHTLQSDFHPW